MHGTDQQIQDAHKALDHLDIAPGPLAIRILTAVGMVDRLTAEASQQRTDRLVEHLVSRYTA